MTRKEWRENLTSAAIYEIAREIDRPDADMRIEVILLRFHYDMKHGPEK